MSLIHRPVSVLALLAFSPAFLAAQPKSGRDLGPKVFEAALVRVADLAADPASLIPFPWSNDPLENGWIEIRGHRYVKIELDGAAPDAAYSASLCRLSSPGSCNLLGSISTDSKGRADDVLPLPDALAGSQTGFFILRRNGNTMFVSGFELPLPAPSPALSQAATVSVKGTVAAVAPPASFTVAGFPLPILTDAKTKFLAGLDFSDLKAGMDVEVSGTVTSAGAILAAEVHLRK